MRIGLLTVATKKYNAFVNPLWISVQNMFCPGDDVTMYVHSDVNTGDVSIGKYKMVHIPQDHLGWPFSTLYRYRIFSRNYWRFIKENDFLFYMDIDMKFVGPVGKEILSNHVATMHPGFCRHDHAPFPHERRETSRAFVAPDNRKAYYCGGFQGGSASFYMISCAFLATQIEEDLNSGIVAEWHDESHWNRWCISTPPSLILPPEYCVPEEFAKDWPKPPKILALKKDHAKFRS